MLQRSDQVPHFQVTALDGHAVAYETFWQHRHLLLICVDDADDAASARLGAVARDLAARAADVDGLGARLVVTHDEVPGVPRPGVVIADRWGEVFTVIDDPARFDADDLVEWLRWLQMKCPECEGEAY